MFHLAKATEAFAVVEELERIALGVGQIHRRVTTPEGGRRTDLAFFAGFLICA